MCRIGQAQGAARLRETVPLVRTRHPWTEPGDRIRRPPGPPPAPANGFVNRRRRDSATRLFLGEEAVPVLELAGPSRSLVVEISGERHGERWSVVGDDE